VTPRAFCAFAWVTLLAAAGAGCGGQDGSGSERGAPEADARVVVSFDGYVYVDASASTAAALDRVQHQQQSAIASLRRHHITVDARRQGVDPRTLTREPVRVVDRAPGAAAEAVRVRYRFRSLARVARSGARADLPLGLVQSDGPTARAELAAACVPKAELDAEAKAAPWRSFDAGLPACTEAVSAEQRRITAARASLGSPTDVTTIEVERMLLPATVRVRPRRPRTAAPRTPRARSSASAAATAEPAPTASAAAEPTDPALDPLAEAAPPEDDGFDDVPDDPGGAGEPHGDGDAPTGHPDPGGSKWLEPNYYVLAFVAVALLVLLRRKRS
jgi:hypothetical protein